MIFLLSCEPGGPGKNTNENDQTEGPDSIFSYKKVGLKNYYSLEVPEPCEKTKLFGDDAASQYVSLKYLFGVLIINEEINATKSAMNILKIELEESKVDTLFIDYYMQFQLNNLKTVALNYDYPVVKETEIDGHKARIFELTTDVKTDKIRRCFAGVAIEGKSQVYYMYMFYPMDKQEEYREIKEHILESFDLDERAFDVSSNSEKDRLETKETKRQSGNTRKK